ncbi:hypothetical protein CEXT_749131 [Caerostris extrusa]|uniref:Uncharacterized protein n=1 Tax=Caerostris extrusa TaxID=172846 RepID=A0AAV4TG75_CAEEX|nr:hypothetical protein CEXT_749131 [Caerostris extrusa]
MDPILLRGWDGELRISLSADDACGQSVTWNILAFKFIPIHSHDGHAVLQTKKIVRKISIQNAIPAKSPSLSGGTQRPEEREICNRSEPIKGISLSVKERIRSHCKCRFIVDKVGLAARAESLCHVYCWRRRVKGKKKMIGNGGSIRPRNKWIKRNVNLR